MHEEAERPEVCPRWTHFTEFLLCKVPVDAAAGVCPGRDGFTLQEKWTQGCSCRKKEQCDEAVPFCLRGHINWKYFFQYVSGFFILLESSMGFTMFMCMILCLCFQFSDNLRAVCFSNLKHQKYFGTQKTSTCKAAWLSFALRLFPSSVPHQSGQRTLPDCRGGLLLMHRAADNKKGNIAMCWAYVDCFPVLYGWFSFTEWWFSICF